MEYSLEEISAGVIFTHQLLDVIVETEPALLEERWKKINGNTLRKDSPHFNGDEYHVHAKLPGGYEASWGVSGKRRHPNKFPALVPRPVVDAAAKVLKVSPDLLEMFWIQDAEHRKLLIEIKN